MVPVCDGNKISLTFVAISRVVVVVVVGVVVVVVVKIRVVTEGVCLVLDE